MGKRVQVQKIFYLDLDSDLNLDKKIFYIYDPSNLKGGLAGGGWLSTPFPNKTFLPPRSNNPQKRKKLPLCSYARLSAKHLSARGQFRAQNEAYARSKSGYARLSAKHLSARGT